MDPYPIQMHWMLTSLGLVLLVVLIFTLRMETAFLAQTKKYRMQFIFSMASIGIMIFLILVLLFHWLLTPIFTFTAMMLLIPLLMVLSPLILWLRNKAFREMTQQRREEQIKLLEEIQDMLDQKKREKIRQGKIDRGEPLNE